MKKLSTALATLLLVAHSDVVLACGGETAIPTSKSFDGMDCRARLKAIKSRSQFTYWKICEEKRLAEENPDGAMAAQSHSDAPPPPSPFGAVDSATCSLLDPSDQSIDSCLIDLITDGELIPYPACPSFVSEVAVGDMAFFVLTDRHPELWKQFVPESGKPGVVAYLDWIGEDGRRPRLQTDLRGLLSE